MKNYENFILEQNQDETQEDWSLSIDISKMWSQYEKSEVTIEQFNTAYINFLNNNQQIIQDKTSAWNKLTEIIVKLEEKKSDEEGCFSIWNDIYDWADSNLVEINAKYKSDF